VGRKIPIRLKVDGIFLFFVKIKMKVKTIYVDLKESKQQKKNGKDVRILESVAFKDPIKMDIVFDEEEKAYFKLIKENCEDIYQQIRESLNAIKEQQKVFEEYKITTEQEINEKDKKIARMQKENALQQTKIKQVSSEVEMIKQAILSQNEEISDITEKISQISSSLKRKPTLIKETIFLS
jgi:chromosome segregation ATPase